jgi:hypothetical protein
VRSYWPLILLLAAMGGASYLSIKLAVEDIAPAAMIGGIALIVVGATLASGQRLFGYGPQETPA